MRIASDSFSMNFLTQINQLQQQQTTLQQESATGLDISLPSDNPGVMSNVLNLQTASSEDTQYENNITSLQASATTSYTAMNGEGGLKAIIDQVNEIATEATNGTNSPTQLATYASQVSGLLQQAVQIGNTQDANGNYIFGGTVTNVPPFKATTDANGNVTAVTYQGNSTVASSEIAPNTTVSAQTPGANTSGSGPQGLFTDSRTGADLFNHMIALQQDLTSGNTSAITSTDAPALEKDENNVITSISANSVMQSTLTNATNIATAQSTNLTGQISNSTSADLATTLTQLNQTQTAYQAALESGTMVFSVSLLNYLQ
jgi:flagellar hook-associated protein 3 FlgL